jgi:pyridoxal phosphate enzyme (YggS family)
LGVKENLQEILRRIEEKALECEREAQQIRLVAVSKTMPVDLMLDAIGAGVGALGENRVQEAKAKWPRVQEAMASQGCEFHLVGHLQRNKAKEAVKLFDLIHSLDSERLALELERRAAEAGKVQRVLIEVNTSGDESKFGAAPEATETLLRTTLDCPHLKVEGLMTIGPLYGGLYGARECFQMLRRIRDDLGGEKLLPDLSMGMTQDFEAAIEEGATIVRIGTAIFGTRN